MAHAEGITRDAWLRTLRGECDYTGAQMRAASVRCDTARRNLAAALLERDPEAIAVAYIDLEERLVGARITARAHGQAREALEREFGMAYGRAGGLDVDGYAGRERVPGRPDESAAVPGARRAVRSLLALGWLSQHVVSSLMRLTTARRL
ncbi:hypothetical protein ABH926_006170 [Catenulispora sp. GP43]|uniref:hypothetical protein n=1 Tax=Catenulispora sp. GP43 TaxID=3156263 RepID=UPI003516270A